MRLFRMGEHPDYEPKLMDCLAAEASRAGVPVLARIYDALLEDDGKALLYFPVYNYTGMNLDVVREMLSHPRALVGLGDAGAHVGTVCDASFPTFMLTHWVRDRAAGRLPLERAVEMLSSRNARHLGLGDRGLVASGRRADLNVIDPQRLRLTVPQLVRDLPAGGKRFLQRATGYRATLVRGEIIADDGRVTAARPGRSAVGTPSRWTGRPATQVRT
jgi:N-acyl-D-aspartate/D-glutamate deacylase